MKAQCKSVDGFYICELTAGHTCRHREGTHTWLDQSVVVARTTNGKEKCGEEFDGSICKLRKGHGGRHVDGTGGNGPLSWTDASKQQVLAEREAAATRLRV